MDFLRLVTENIDYSLKPDVPEKIYHEGTLLLYGHFPGTPSICKWERDISKADV